MYLLVIIKNILCIYSLNISLVSLLTHRNAGTGYSSLQSETCLLWHEDSYMISTRYIRELWMGE